MRHSIAMVKEAKVCIIFVLKEINTGNYDGKEIIQLYLRDVIRSITPPRRKLKG
ncbi:MAG: hypothetical protein ACK5L5_07460 [Bacteroidales bacterium]